MVAATMTALIPGEGPPPTRMPSVFMASPRALRRAAGSSHHQHDLPELPALGEAPLGGRAVLEGDDLVHDRLEAPREEQAHHVVELLPVRHRRAEDVDLLPEDLADVRLADRPRRRAAGDEPAALAQRAERLPPGRGADVLEDDVHAAPAGL